MNTRRGDRLLSLVSSGRNGQAANDLLAEFFDGYPLERLRVLLHSDDVRAATAGAFIASELGDRFAPLISEAPRMLAHSASNVRFDALDVVLCNAGGEHGEIIAPAVLLIQDEDEAVRWKTLRFLSMASDEQLEASVRHLSDNTVGRLASWLLASGKSGWGEEIKARLQAPDRLTRLFALVAAVRLGSHDAGPLKSAANSTDPVVRSFAEEVLDSLADEALPKG